MRRRALVAAALAALLAGCADLPLLGSRPPDPPRALPLADILRAPDGTLVATEPLRVVGVQNASGAPSRGSWKSPSLVTAEDDAGARLSFLLDTDETTQHRKQLGVPALGMRVSAQGYVARGANGTLLKPTLRWAPHDHDGATVSAQEVADGRIAEGSWVWLHPARVSTVRRESDGDVHVALGVPGGRLVTERTPPFPGLDAPEVGEEVAVFGMVLHDTTHGWWELHPVLCWSRARCAAPLETFDAPRAGED